MGKALGMRIVVTGATGNVGTSVVAALASDPRVSEIVGLARRRPQLQSPRTTWVQADVLTAPLEDLFRGADAVIHLAWLIQPSHDGASSRRSTWAARGGCSRPRRRPAPARSCTPRRSAPTRPGRSIARSTSHGRRGGTPTSFYARHKVAAERLLDAVEAAHPKLRVVRLRPALIFKREAASGIRRLFAGPLLPSPLVRPALLPLLPLPAGLRVQGVHSADVGEAYRLAATDGRARGAYNVAADPVLDAGSLAAALGARAVSVPVPAGPRRRSTSAGGCGCSRRPRAGSTWAWRCRCMDSSRIRDELGWAPRHARRRRAARTARGNPLVRGRADAAAGSAHRRVPALARVRDRRRAAPAPSRSAPPTRCA